MTKDRNIAAESMSGLLEVMHTQQWSGMLRAEYSQEGHREEGEIYLSAGQPIYAQTGRLIGYEALKHLLAWQKLYFAFETDVPRPKANLTTTHYLGNVGQSEMPVRFPAPVQTPVSAFQRPKTEELKWNAVAEQSNSTPSRNSVPGIERLVPQKIGPGRETLALALSRRQRHIYFMVDGRRTVSDLARFTNKTVLEVETILNELQEQDMVVI